MSDGVVYGSYVLLGRLAQGGMAEVFLGKTLDNRDPERLLAIKRMLPQYSDDAALVSMFSDEARIAKSLSHSNICKVLDFGNLDHQLFMVMEFIHGKDLRITQRRAGERGEPIPFRFVAYVIARIAEALDYAHHQTPAMGIVENIVHGDVSPQNILLSYDGMPKLIDFGLAKARDRIDKSRMGVMTSQSAYVSPEQANGQPLDGRSDIFSLGAVLYELLTGERPFTGANDLAVLQKIVRVEYTPPEAINSTIPRRLAAVVERAMAKDRERRYARGAEMTIDLERYLADENREVSVAGLSAYTRKLFRDDYIREMSRIKMFFAVDPRKAQPEATKTDDAESQFLAAGYDASLAPSEVTVGKASTGDAPSEPMLVSTADLVLDALPGPTDDAAPFAEAPVSDAGQQPPAVKPLADEPTPAQSSLWEGADAPATDETPSPLEATITAPNEPSAAGAVNGHRADELEPTTDPEPVFHAAPDERPAVTGPPILRPVGDSANSMFEAKTEEFSAMPLMTDPALAAALEQHRSNERQDGGEARRMPSPNSDVGGSLQDKTQALSLQDKTQALSLQQVEEFEILEASRVVSLTDLSLSTQPEAQVGIHELGNKELEAIVEETPDVAPRAPEVSTTVLPGSGPHPMPAVSPGDFDDILTREKPRGRPPGAQSALADPAPEPILGSSELRRRGRLFSDVELTVIILAVAIGMLTIVGTYWYASTMPIESPKTVVTPIDADPAKPR